MRYSRDPYPIEVRYASKCSGCDKPIQRGERAFYFPNGKRLFGMTSCDCGVEARGEFLMAAHDESMITGEW